MASQNPAPVFQLTVVSQNDAGCAAGKELTVNVAMPTGGTLQNQSWPTGEEVPLPIPPPPRPPPSPTWWLTLGDGGIEGASYSLVISGPDGANPTKITINGRDMPGWVLDNQKQDTNQIYNESSCGIFGYAQYVAKPGQPVTWIYTVTAGVDHPKVHPGGA